MCCLEMASTSVGSPRARKTRSAHGTGIDDDRSRGPIVGRESALEALIEAQYVPASRCASLSARELGYPAFERCARTAQSEVQVRRCFAQPSMLDITCLIRV